MTSLFNLAAIAVGGATGSLCRYGVTVAADAIPGGSTLWGTTIVNVIGCGLLGGITALESSDTEVSAHLMFALRVGFVGSLTTFSTFAGESTVLAGQGRWAASGIYVLANLILGWTALIAVSSWVGGMTD